METNSEASRSPVNNVIALVGSSLALVAGGKGVHHHKEPGPLVKHPEAHEVSFVQADSSVPVHHVRPDNCQHAHTGSHQERVKQEVLSFFIGKGLKAFQAAGIDGNIGQESDWNNSNSGGYLAQWGGGRLAALEQFADRLNQPVTSTKVQLKYAWLELTNGPGAGEDDTSVLRHLQEAKTAEAATLIFSNEYERPSDPMIENRIMYAKQILRKFGHIACASTGPKARIAIPKTSLVEPR